MNAFMVKLRACMSVWDPIVLSEPSHQSQNICDFVSPFIV